MAITTNGEVDDKGRIWVSCDVCEFQRFAYGPLETVVHACRDGMPPRSPSVAASSNLGISLASIISSLDVKKTAGCNCDEMMARMNAWGIEGCEEHREEILAHLNKAYAELNPSWADQARMGAKALAMGIVINPFDPAGSLLNAAIERARKNQPAIPPT